MVKLGTTLFSIFLYAIVPAFSFIYAFFKTVVQAQRTQIEIRSNDLPNASSCDY